MVPHLIVGRLANRPGEKENKHKQKEIGGMI